MRVTKHISHMTGIAKIFYLNQALLNNPYFWGGRYVWGGVLGWTSHDSLTILISRRPPAISWRSGHECRGLQDEAPMDSTIDHGIQPLTTTTVDGWNPAPVDMVNIPLFIGFHTSQVVQDFSHQQYHPGKWTAGTYKLFTPIEQEKHHLNHPPPFFGGSEC